MRISKWWGERSATFSSGKEEFTHGEVVSVYLFIIGLLLLCGLAESIGG